MAKPGVHSAVGQLQRIGRVIRFVWPFTRARAILALCLLLAAGVTEGVSILLIVPILASLIPGATTVDLSLGALLPDIPNLPQFQVELLPLLSLLVVAVVLQGALARASNLAIIDATLNAAHAIRAQLFEAVGFARWQKIMTGRHADITHAMTMDVDRVNVVLSALLFMMQALVMLGFYVSLAFLVSPFMTIGAVCFGTVFLVLLFPLRNFASRYGERLSLQRQAQYRTIGEFLRGLKVFKSLNAEGRYVGAFSANSDTLTRDLKRLARVTALPPYLFQVASAIGAAVFVYSSVRYFSLPVEQIGVLLFLFMKIAPRFTNIQADYQNLIINVGGYDNLAEVIEVYREHQERPDEPPQPALRLDRSLDFEGVSFAYGPEQAHIISDASFRIPARQITALIGASGSGKSTAADLIMGLLLPSQGAIFIDGKELGPAERRAWRESIAYVPQDVYLTNDTVRANLAFASPNATEAAMWDALEKAQAAGLVRGLPEGLDTPLGENGVRLSGGERQRIALARGLLRQPDVLILDEATSALDWQNQAMIAEAIQALRGSMTVITIAHRPSMIGFADWVVAIGEGKIIETGPFNAFAAKEGSQLSRLLAGETAKVSQPRDSILPPSTSDVA